MERFCNVLTCLSVIYSLVVCITSKLLTSITGYTFEILILQVLFVLLCSHDLIGLKNQGKYRPEVDPNLMCLFLVPLCLINEMITNASKTDSSIKMENIGLCLGVTAICITKCFFLVDKNKLTSFAVLFVTVGYLLVFANLITIVAFVVSSMVVWKSMDWIPRVAPRSFSLAEMCVCLQLGICFIARMSKELFKMQTVLQDELRLKWIGATAVTGILIATAMIWAMKSFLSVFSCLSFVCVYLALAVASFGFLTWVFQDNLLFWFFHLIEGNCTLKMLLISWALFCGITVIWTVKHALQMMTIHKGKKEESDVPQYSSGERQERGEDTFGDFRYRKCAGSLEEEAEQDCHLGTKGSEGLTAHHGVLFDTRKVFHVFILLVYIPGLLIAPHFLFLASCLAFGIFIIVEAARVLQLPAIGPQLDGILRAFVDERDQGVLFLTHFYLLIGLSLPLWISNSSFTTVSSLKLYSGVLSLGIGDTVACVFGRAFGRHKWKGTKKTVEGTLGSIVAQLTFIYTCSYCNIIPSYSHMAVWIGVVHSALFEAFTDQIDNLVLPLALYPFLCMA